jgi:hypothetical protein
MKMKLIGVTEYAKRHLSVDELAILENMIGCDVEESDNKAAIDGGRMFIMPDGEETHVCFLSLAPLTPTQ